MMWITKSNWVVLVQFFYLLLKEYCLPCYEHNITTLQMNGLYGGPNKYDPDNHIRKFMNVYGLLSFKNVSQELVYHR